MLLSLAELPLTAGFMGKFLVLKAGMATEDGYFLGRRLAGLDLTDYAAVRGLSTEVQQKLNLHRPETIGQAYVSLSDTLYLAASAYSLPGFKTSNGLLLGRAKITLPASSIAP